ncbi:MAG: methyltransferase [Candidatus Gracilibacteria bacterium]
MPPPTELTLNVSLKGREFTFKTTWGLFSPKEIDEGTRLLIENVNVNPKDDIFDLGCGYGPIGIVLGSLATKGSVLMVDKDFVATEYAQKNIELNGLKNAKVILSNAFSAVPQDQQFDLIISNLPAKPGKEFFEIMMQDAYTHLKPGGRICVVTITGLREYIKRTFKELFGNYQKIAERKGYTVAEAVKE